MKKSTKVFLISVTLIIVSAQIFSTLFIQSFEKELIEYREDKHFIEQSVDLYALACTTPSGASEEECQELRDKVHVTYDKMNNEYKLVNFYVKYIAK